MPGDTPYLNNKASSNNTYDAIIVGSGISGGWAAKELCEKGLKVLLLERGGNVVHPAYPTATPSPSIPLTGALPPTLSCLLCPEGMSLPNPELVLSGGETCGDLSDLANGLSPVQCELQKDVLTISAVSCGCS